MWQKQFYLYHNQHRVHALQPEDYPTKVEFDSYQNYFDY